MKVLIGVDGSQGALQAVRRAGQWLTPGRDQVAFYLSAKHAHPQSLSSQHAALENVLAKLAEEVFAEAAAELPADLSAGVETFYDSERPTAGLLAAAERWGAELLVVGARGRGPLAQVLLGSVAKRVVHQARLPVLVVRGAASAAPRILLAYDGGAASMAAAEFLTQLEWPPQSRGRIVSVLEHYTVGHLPEWAATKPRDPEIEAMTQGWVEEHAQVRAAREQELHGVIARLPPPFQSAAPVLCEGNPAEELLRLVGAEQVDLVVVGTNNAGVLTRLMLGSVSGTVLTYAPCSVLVVPQRG